VKKSWRKVHWPGYFVPVTQQWKRLYVPFPSVAFLTKSTCELLMNVSSSNFGLSIIQIDIDRDQLLRQNPAAYTQSLDLAVRGLYRYSSCIVSCSSLMFLFLQVMLHQYWVGDVWEIDWTSMARWHVRIVQLVCSFCTRQHITDLFLLFGYSIIR
jgi:hypothetical protein